MNTIPEGPFCQSCSMPLHKPEDFGTNADGTQSMDYCHFCYANGQFTWPDATLEQMIEKLVSMSSQMGMTPEETRGMATSFLPTLKRWAR